MNTMCHAVVCNNKPTTSQQQAPTGAARDTVPLHAIVTLRSPGPLPYLPDWAKRETEKPTPKHKHNRQSSRSQPLLKGEQMETIDVHSRSFAVKWIHIPAGGHVIFQLKPVKRSISFGVYKSTEQKTSSRTHSPYAAGGNSNNSSSQSLHRKRSASTLNVPLEERLRQSSLVEVKSYGMLQANALFKGELKMEAGRGGIFAFVFDNTFSKSYAKKVMFNKFFVEATATPASRRLSTSSSSVNLQSQLHPRNGQYLAGYLLKRKRKKLQGFTKRYFVLNFKYNTLSYYMNEASQKFRGEMQINLATVSAFKEENTIVIDSGVEIWILKTKSPEDWDNWTNALDFIKLNSAPIEEPLSSQDASPSFAPSNVKIDEEAEDHNAELSTINEKLESLRISLADVGQRLDSSLLVDANDQLDSLTSYVKRLLITRGMQNSGLVDSGSIFSDDYFDALDQLDSALDNHVLLLPGGSTGSHISVEELSDQDESFMDLTPREIGSSTEDLYPLPLDPVARRDDIPKCTSSPPSLFSHLRKNVGKDLSTISMPVTSNEPLTILQRMAEMFEHSYLLNHAAQESNIDLKMIQVATFAIANLGSLRAKERNLRKPFNPILGETFELVDERQGYRMIAEKINHKPQIFAFHCESSLWEISFTLCPEQKFWGKSMELINTGPVTLALKPSGETFKWDQPTTLLKNIIAGERYTEPTNNVTVTSSSGLKSVVEFRKPSSGLFSTPRCEEVGINVMDKSGKKSEWFADGNWTNEIVARRSSDHKFMQRLYKASELLKDEARKWGFTLFASNLNDISPIEKGLIPIVDSRLRPDVRLYENGDVKNAEQMKLAIEQRQRERRKQVAEANEVHHPLFFSGTESGNWEVVKGPLGYWERRRLGDWSGVTPLW